MLVLKLPRFISAYEDVLARYLFLIRARARDVTDVTRVPCASLYRSRDPLALAVCRESNVPRCIVALTLL